MDQRLHNGPTMMRPLGFWLALFAWLALPAFAFAQDDDSDSDENTLGLNNSGGLGVVLYIDQKTVDLRKNPLGKRACDENWQLAFEISGFATGQDTEPLVAIWYGDNCNSEQKRDLVEENDCKQIGTPQERETRNLEQTFTIPMEEFCDLTTANIDVYFLPVDSDRSSGTIDTYGVFRLVIDLDPPEPPTNVRSQPGETEIPIDWEPNDSNIFQNWLVWDTVPVGAEDLEGLDAGAIGESDCLSASLIPGQEFDLSSPPPGIRQQAVSDVRSYSLNGTTLGADRVALGIISEDLAGNRSLVSNLTCVTVVPTDGFWDAYQNAGGDIEQGCACSLPGQRPRPNRLAFVPLVLAVVLVALRSRRKRRS